jgi:purine-binding chemotaxis protein CheW
MVEPSPRPAANRLRLVCFTLHDQEYGVAIESVKETLAVRPITRMFLTPPWLAGIMNLRGDVVAVLDLARFLGMAATGAGDDSRIVVVRRGALVVGILVDRMAEVRQIETAALAAPPPNLPAELAQVLRGIVAVDGGAVRVLDIASLFDSDRVRALERGGS